MIEIVRRVAFNLEPTRDAKLALAVYRLQPIQLVTDLLDYFHFANSFTHLSITPIILINVIVT